MARKTKMLSADAAPKIRQHSAMPGAEKRDPKVSLFKNTEKGDVVILEDPESPVLFRLCRVAATTKTLIFVEGQRYLRTDGIRYGMGAYDYPQRIHPASKGNVRRMKEYLMRRDLKAAVRNAFDLRLHELVTLEEGHNVLKALEAAFDGILTRRQKE